MSQSPRFFRKQLVIPSEHGAWSWLLVPFLVGVAVAGQWHTAVLWVLVGGLSFFLLRQPATAWVRTRSGRGRRADGPLAAGWMAAFGLLSVLSLLGLLWSGRSAILWLMLPGAAVFGLYMAAARQRRASVRSLWMEVAGAAGLALMAPAATIAATGRLDSRAWAVWGLMAAQNVLGVLYVRLRIADTHQREMDRRPVLWLHGLFLLVIVLAAWQGWLPWLAAVPFAGFFVRAIWAVRAPRPLANIKRFGFSEIGVELLGGLLVSLGYWLS
jgi:hypothetical protein